ncbi:MAG: acyl-CoA synthetase [Rhodospirillaceae bacterium]|nr:acyl-CoA synthetase [Rhodospirillaceae bacterium]
MQSPYDIDLDRNAANYQPLSPVNFLVRAAAVYPNKTAVIHGDTSFTYAEFYTRSRRLASALAKRGIGRGDTVSIMAPNVPPLLEAHYAVPMLGAVLNALNIRLDASAIAFMLDHGEAKVILTDRMFSGVIKEALEIATNTPLVIDIDDPLDQSGELLGEMDYETFLQEGDPEFTWTPPEDEWQALSLNYTSGTTGDPKGVVYHHRGAFLNALGNTISFGLSPQTVYLWTLPMFHCNGWTYTWAVTAACGTHVCLRAVDPALIFPMIEEHKVTHMCGAPIVLTMLIHAPRETQRTFDHGPIEIATGGAAPPSAVIEGMEKMGFRVTHLYGMTESYGPSTLCAWQSDWDDLEGDARAAVMARQGVNYVTLEDQTVMDSETMQPVPADGETIGELMLRGNTVMRGYLKNPKTTNDTLSGGWLHTGDLAVMHEDGYIEIKDRAKDIIISGGENISSLEIEEVLYKHPKIMEAAVVARPDEKWGESPCAFVTPVEGETGLDEAEVTAYCRENMAHFKCPKTIIFSELPKTSTGKIQKFVLRERARGM